MSHALMAMRTVRVRYIQADAVTSEWRYACCAANNTRRDENYSQIKPIFLSIFMMS
jgi:hypothetical protein